MKRLFLRLMFGGDSLVDHFAAIMKHRARIAKARQKADDLLLEQERLNTLRKQNAEQHTAALADHNEAREKLQQVFASP